MKKYILILLTLTFSLMTTVEPAMAAPAQSSMTQKQREKARKQAQKAKEKARKQAQKEKEKARKQAAKEKDQARKQAVKEKEAGKKASDREKVEAMRAKEADRKQQVADDKARQKELAAARKAGDKTWYTKSSDIHSLNFYGGVGYSNIMNKHVSGSNVGGVGGMLGVAYELRHNHFIFDLGPEFRIFNSADKFNQAAMYAGQQYPGMEYYYAAEMKETQTVGQIMVPVLFGGTFGKVYFLVGPKVGFGLLGNWKQTGTLTTTVHDADAYDPIWEQLNNHYMVPQAVDAHTLYDHKSLSGNHGFGLDVTASAEVGLNLEEFFSQDWQERNEARPKPWHFRVAAFVDYGLPIMGFSKLNVEGVDIDPVSLGGNMVPQERGEALPQMQTNTSLLETGWTTSKLNSLLVGVKMTAQLQLTKPKLPNPRIVVRIEDAFTGKVLSGAKISMHYVGDRRKPQLKAMKKDGTFTARYAKGEYDMKALANGYLDSDPIVYDHEEDLADPVVFRLIPRPMLTVMVHDKHDDHLVPATVTFVSDQTGESQVLNVAAGQPGKISLHYGDTYSVRITAPEYHDTTATVTDLYASENYYLTPLVRIRRVLILKNMYFAVDKTDILPGSEEEINKLYTFLVENPKIRVLITGHTDSDGSEEHNQKLSEGRAASLKNEMVARGIDADRMETNGKGESEPIDTNDTPEGKQNNRRIEVTVLNAEDATVDVY